MDILQLLETNVGDIRLQKNPRIVLVSSCLLDRTYECLDQFNDRPWVKICLEAVHINHAGFKFVQMIQYSKIREVTVLTIDGSPHCVQAHFLVEDIKKRFVQDLTVNHFVIEKGKLIEISADAVKTARHLSKVEKLVSN